ncbi:MAG: HTTM domain-containing protein [Proteobacteria bacterium]|nr:HTTM domain-containing protein [Pseudomonadota bacterium]
MKTDPLAALGAALKSTWTADLRSLAAMRIALGLVLTYDLIDRTFDLEAFYTDAGVIPLAVIRDQLSEKGWWSLHALHGSIGYIYFLHAIAIAAAISMTLGYRTRLASALSWILLVSLVNRNFLTVYPGDYLMRMLLLVGIFLPWGQRISVDQLRRSRGENRDNQVRNPATIAFFCFVSFFFFAAGLSKTGPSWQDGTAVYYMLSLRWFATGYGDFLLQWPGITQPLTYANLYIELLSPLLLFFPWKNGPIRTAFIVSVIAQLIVIRLFMSTYLLSHIMIAGFLGMLPGWSWEQVGRIPGVGAICAKWDLRGAAAPQRAGRDSRWFATMHKLTGLDNVIPALLVALVLWSELIRLGQARYSLPELPLPRPLDTIAQTARLPNHWTMFPKPKSYGDFWYVVEATTKDGRTYDLLRNAPLDWQMPAVIPDTLPNFRWGRYMLEMNAGRRENRNPDLFRSLYADYAARSWNAGRPASQALDHLRIVVPWRSSYYIGQEVPPIQTDVVAEFDFE